jgi:hypothetical protein
LLRDEQQLARACRTLLASVRLERLWTEDGPTPEAARLVEDQAALLSRGQRIVLVMAWTFWNGSGGPTLAEVLGRFAAGPMAALRVLVAASAYSEYSRVEERSSSIRPYRC